MLQLKLDIFVYSAIVMSDFLIMCMYAMYICPKNSILKSTIDQPLSKVHANLTNPASEPSPKPSLLVTPVSKLHE